MKRFVTALSIVMMLVALSACTAADPNSGKSVDSGKSAGDVATTAPAQDATTQAPAETTEPTAAPNAAVTIAEQEVYNKDKVKITAKSLSLDGLMGPALKVLIENDSDKSVTVQVSSVAINGFMVNAIMSSDVAAGKKANEEVTFLSSDLEAAGITVIKDLDLVFHIVDSESFSTLADSDIVRIQTTADTNYVQPIDDSGFVALDKNKIKVVVKKLNDTTSFWGADLYLYVENNSDKDVTVQVQDVSLNGFMMNPAFSCQLLPGKKAISAVIFLEDELKNNDITKFESLELVFHVFDSKTFDTIFDSDNVKVTFEK